MTRSRAKARATRARAFFSVCFWMVHMNLILVHCMTDIQLKSVLVWQDGGLIGLLFFLSHDHLSYLNHNKSFVTLLLHTSTISCYSQGPNLMYPFNKRVNTKDSHIKLLNSCQLVSFQIDLVLLASSDHNLLCTLGWFPV